jgi:ABC-type antimicrobial peptide transport system permease subunit
MAPARVMAMLIALFAIIAVAISLAGVGGVVNASVNARVRDLGVQLALGATRVRVLRSVLGQAVGLAIPGIGLGLALALILGRALQALLFEVQPHDATTLAAVAAALLVVTLGACLVPARRAALVDPNVAIRVG